MSGGAQGLDPPSLLRYIQLKSPVNYLDENHLYVWNHIILIDQFTMQSSKLDQSPFTVQQYLQGSKTLPGGTMTVMMPLIS